MSTEKWVKYKLNDVIDVFIDYRGKTPTKSESGVPLITAKVVKNGRIEVPNEFIPEKDFENWMTRGLPEIGDVVLTTEAPLGEVAQIDIAGKVALAQRIITMRGKKGVLDNSFLKYAFQTDRMQERLSGRATGTTVTGIKSSELREIEIELPDFSTQRRITAILTTLDDKIELNRRMNETLEGIAQALWGEWFGKYASGEEELPEGWRWGKLGEITEIKGGTTPSTAVADYWNGDINWTSPRDLSSLRFPVLLETEKKITERGLRQISSGLLPKGTLLLSSRAPIGYLAITQIPVAINQGYIAINCLNDYSNLFILFWLKANMEKVIERANGSTFLEISKSNFREIEILLPEQSIHDNFIELGSPIFEKIVENELQSRLLTATKDALLPKLMTGQIEI